MPQYKGPFLYYPQAALDGFAVKIHVTQLLIINVTVVIERHGHSAQSVCMQPVLKVFCLVTVWHHLDIRRFKIPMQQHEGSFMC